MHKMQSEADPANGARLAMLEKVIAEHILIPPKFAKYPEVEEILWRPVQRVMVNQLGVDEGLRLMREQIKEIVGGPSLDIRSRLVANTKRGLCLSRLE